MWKGRTLVNGTGKDRTSLEKSIGELSDVELGSPVANLLS